MNAPDRYERFVVPEGMKKYAACWSRYMLACYNIQGVVPAIGIADASVVILSSEVVVFCLWGFRVAYERDMKVMNAATFTVEREDHTVGNVIRMYAHLLG